MLARILEFHILFIN